MSSSVDEYERRAQEAEASNVPTFLKIGRAVVWMIYALALVVVVILLLAFLLKLFGASTDASFTRWVYRSADSAMRPFRGIFPSTQLNDQSVFDPSLLFGAICYTVAAIAADALHHWLSGKLTRERAAIARARADADNVRWQYETQEAKARQAALELAAQQEARRREAAQQATAAQEAATQQIAAAQAAAARQAAAQRAAAEAAREVIEMTPPPAPPPGDPT
jgi:uncharacterized protein YggT (Ycf19 family)